MGHPRKSPDHEPFTILLAFGIVVAVGLLVLLVSPGF